MALVAGSGLVIAGIATGAGTTPLIVFALVTYVLFRLRLWTAVETGGSSGYVFTRSLIAVALK